MSKPTRTRRILLTLGMVLAALLALVSVPLAIVAAFRISDPLLLDSVAETAARFGPVPEGGLKTVEITGPRAAILSLGGRIFSPLEPLADTRWYSIAYDSDGLVVTGVMMTPTAPGTYPCIVYNRGGNRDFGRVDLRQAAYFMAPYAAAGYVVVASNYRGNNGSEGAEEFGGSDVRDVLNLAAALANVPSADASRVGVLGHSRGGMMTYRALQREGVFDAAVVVAGSANLFENAEKRPDMETHVYAELIPDYADRRDEALEARSVVRWPEELDRVPLLLAHGTADDRVPYSEAQQLAEGLDELGFPYHFVTFEGGSHNLREFDRELPDRVIAFFDRHLRDSRPLEEPGRRTTVPARP